MELWRQCAAWLIQCRVLPENHRVTWETAQVCDLAHALRDGVLLCQLLNNLLSQSINLKDINLRPQMSQSCWSCRSCCLNAGVAQAGASGFHANMPTKS
ncbi:hypothetical protein SKAU_G00380180 [Synaphobranchus kaupii]|uniref:Calponin-homology (CH) domain-containing protein n=1 Tax=Synaphobranchus kaupii TaxID=118154 RepID=A0A9Q1EDH8_SYNKA|nr:hypothetical protein SKAU_G00380180 [Synaphobranchus kaupii]